MLVKEEDQLTPSQRLPGICVPDLRTLGRLVLAPNYFPIAFMSSMVSMIFRASRMSTLRSIYARFGM